MTHRSQSEEPGGADEIEAAHDALLDGAGGPIPPAGAPAIRRDPLDPYDPQGPDGHRQPPAG